MDTTLKNTGNSRLQSIGDWAELKGQVVDIFEDFLSKQNIIIQNTDRDDAMIESILEDDLDTQNINSLKDARDVRINECLQGTQFRTLDLAIIFGKDYDTIADTVETELAPFADAGKRMTKEETENVILHILVIFFSLLSPEQVLLITMAHCRRLKNSILNLLENWELLLRKEEL